MKYLLDNYPTAYDKKLAIANATFKGVRCDVQMTPKFNISGAMTYDVKYSIISASYKVEYD